MSFAVVIPSKTETNLLSCVAHVRRCEPNVQIIVVDDGLTGWPRGVVVIPGSKPFCYAANCNLGMMRALDNHEGIEDHNGIVLLNDDALLQTPGGFSHMAELAKDRPEVGVLSATCNRIGNPNQRPNQRPAFRYDHRMLAFVCVYIPRWVIEKLGLLDERFTAYGCEDCDYCKRVLNAGLKLGITEECFVDHASLPASFRGAKDHQQQMMAGREIYFEKWGVQP